MRAHDTRPRIASQEVRKFAEWMESRGWECTGVDAKDHTCWRYPGTGATHKLPGTPKYYDVRRGRADVIRKEGKDPGIEEGKRRAGRRKAEAAARRERDAQRLADQEAERQARMDALVIEAHRMDALRDLREACGYAQAALRARPHDPKCRAHFDRLRAQYRDLLNGGAA